MFKTINFTSILKKLSILITAMLAIGVILIPLWVSIQASAQQKGYNNLEQVEGILNINFNDKTSFVSAINNLKFLKLKQEIGINSITGYTIEDNNILPFVFNGQVSETNQAGVILLSNLEYEFKSGYTAYLKELRAIKENKINLESPVSSNSEKITNSIDKNQVKGIKSIVSSYSNNDFEIAKNKTKWFNNNLFIDKITISASIKTLNLITSNKQIKPTIKTSELTNLLQIEKKFKEKQLVLENKINAEIKKIENEKAKSIQNKPLMNEEKDKIKNQIAENEIKYELDRLNSIQTNQPQNNKTNPLASLTKQEQELFKQITPEQIKRIDNKIVVDQKGNNQIDVNSIKTDKTIKPQTANLIKKLIDNTNKTSDIDKEINLLQPIMTKAIIDPVKDNSIAGKLGAALSGKVEAQAWSTTGCWSYRYQFWWGYNYAFSKCVTENSISYFRNLATYLSWGRWAGAAAPFARFAWVANAAWLLEAHGFIYNHLANLLEKTLWCNQGSQIATSFYGWSVYNNCNNQKVN